MCRFVESIRVYNRIANNLEYHNIRLNETRKNNYNVKDNIDLNKALTIPEYLDDKMYKCRVLYQENIAKIEYFLYYKKDIKSLALVEDEDIDYTYKYNDKSDFDRLLAKKGDADDILIIKNGFITDTSSANIVFFDGRNWLTPTSPLLKGTKRAKLLKERAIYEEELTPEDIKRFEKASLINAMIELGDITIEIKNIK